MNHSNEPNNFGENVEESGNNQAESNANLVPTDSGETAGTFTDAVAGAMIGAPFGLFGAVIGGVTGGVIGNQIVDTDEADNDTDSNNRGKYI
jgi:phage tail tape-measure protein